MMVRKGTWWYASTLMYFREQRNKNNIYNECCSLNEVTNQTYLRRLKLKRGSITRDKSEYIPILHFTVTDDWKIKQHIIHNVSSCYVTRVHGENK